MVKAYLVNHTHWDREWYFTVQDAQILSDSVFTEILDELEAHPEANFTLDGQTSIIDEYLELNPSALSRIRKLVARKQLYVGPWYTQTDALLPATESLIRNLVIGINDCKEKYGDPMMIGYLPDTFGFNAQLPMILKQVGIKDFICWRGINFPKQAGSVYFKWKGLGNCEVCVASFPLGYYTGQIALESKQNLQQFVSERLDKGIDFESKHGDNSEVLVPSGIDQMNIVRNLTETLGQINQLSKHEVVIGNYPHFMRSLANKNLNKYTGELRLPTYARVHRTIGSVRSRFKRQNFELEEYILKRVEPLLVLAQKLEIKVSNGVVLKLWKKLLECQPHDTLGGCVSDNVAEDIEHRFKECRELAAGIENYIKKRLAQRLKLKENEVIVFNTELERYVGPKEITILTRTKKIKFSSKYNARIVSEKYTPLRKNIMQQTSRGFEFADEPAYYQLKILVDIELPALGYKVISFEDAEDDLSELITIAGNEISNGSTRISFKQGEFVIETDDKKIPHAIEIWDSANDGDTYDYSPLRGDQEKKLDWDGVLEKRQTTGYEELRLRGAWQLPYMLEDRLTDKTTKKVPYELIVSLEKGRSTADFKLTVDNTILSHRLRLRVNVLSSKTKTIAQIQGGFRVTKNEVIATDWQDEFVEKPVNIYNYDKAVGTSNGIFIFTKGMKEYERSADGLFITLMATTGELGKSDLLWRPGRASGDTTSIGHTMTPTPMAQELGKNSFEFALKLYSGVKETTIARDVEKWLMPSVSYQRQRYNLFVNRLDNKIWDVEFDTKLPQVEKEVEMLKLIDDSYVVSAIYPAYTVKDAVIIRLSNPSAKTVDISKLESEGYLVVNALEEKIAQEFIIDSYDMITLMKNRR